MSRNGIDVLTGVASFKTAPTCRSRNAGRHGSYEAEEHYHRHRHQAGRSPPRCRSTAAPSSTAIRFWTCQTCPQSLIVVGGGVIGVEYTCMFAALGVRVTLIEKRPRLLEFADSGNRRSPFVSSARHRVTMRLNEEVESVEETADRSVVAFLESKKSVIGDALLYAVGRQGNVDELNLQAAGHRGRFTRPHPCRRALSHQAAQHLTRWAM